MTAAAQGPDAETLECRFLIGSGVGETFREALASDMSGAQLSQVFRTYYALRRLLPLRVRQTLQRFRRVAVEPRWAYPDDFVQSLVGQLQQSADPLTIIHPWPDHRAFAFVLTHDVETAEGMQRILQIADLEEELGFRSSWNFVPFRYAIDRRLLRELADRGFEIGVHGYNHDGKLFTSRAEFDRRVPAINRALRSWGAVGFRAPMVHRNLRWMQSLEIQYDASCFDADPYQAMPGGVGGVWPFIAGRFVELPYTFPQDHTLLVVRNERGGQLWSEKLAYLAALNGMALVITHPDYLNSPLRLESYRRLLCGARELAGMWHALPHQVAAWWRSRDELELKKTSAGAWHIVGPAASQARVATLRPGRIQARNSHPIVWTTPSSETTQKFKVPEPGVPFT
jgi:peptidoglycan/xylan/chitin deacetylase (PgdA/CDA1 family)